MSRDTLRFCVGLIVLAALIAAAILAHDSSLPTCLTEGCYR